MPPFRTGLVKRKLNNVDKETERKQSLEGESSETEDLFRSYLTAENDTTDSEHEAEELSDTEQDRVVFEDDDSTLGDDSEHSSDLTDSENNDSDSQVSEESGKESGLDHTYSSDSEGHGHAKPTSATLNKELVNKESIKLIKKNKKTRMKSNELIKNDKEESYIDKLQKQIVNSHIDVPKDEYESGDTSDEEDRRNTVGEVPMWWYQDYPHIGYDLDGRRIMKPPQRDQIDDFLKKCEDPDFWRTVRDPSTGQDVVLSKEDLELLARIKEGRVPNSEHDEYEPWVEWFTREVLATPVRAFPEHKRSFLPSKAEQNQISKLVHALKMGWSKTRKQLAEERRQKRVRRFYDLWGSSEDQERARGVHKHIPAPRRPPPAHAESYNPPPEYLLDAKEAKEWRKLAETPWRRKYTFLPTRHAALRHVPAYPRFVRERFLRCLDLYLAPRAIKMRLTIDPEDLVPKLPSPRDLQPFPTAEVLRFEGHEDLVRCCDFDPSGQYVVSGGDDGTVKIWETSGGRCLRTVRVSEPGAEAESVTQARWTPAGGLSLVAVAAGRRVLLLNPGAGVGAHRVAEQTDRLLREPPPPLDRAVEERVASAARWAEPSAEQWARGVRVLVEHFRPVTHLSWHARGDYLAASMAEGAARGVVVHQVSRRRSQLPFARPKGRVQAALFHPTRPLLFVATQRVVRVYDLVKQELVKKLLTGAQWISTMAVHPAGDNLLVASYDRKCMWFDLDLSSKPYQTLRLHGSAVRALAFHRRYPLFATAGDDPYLVVSHGMVYNDLLQNPLLVPLKQLPGPPRAAELCVLGLSFHPTQPWLLAAGADSTLRLYA